ncbi:iron complex transport system ATP-binding protein [Bosea sp. BE125]|uniref:ATP-binding cassette domain-containing protein n=1 Tax=Bosea sp. BE125 TaxID=2817909 RepID=UPI0028578E0E|nr:ATP-binding cassette domain-containing protein [Bosea sp. BE125]MDR6872159.1 iron complex transport system ATP-binding protein [Bosea sp. BE125]
MTAPRFDLADISFTVPGRAVPGRDILKPLSLALEPGRIHGLIGPNGSGKSTLVKLLARQLAPSAGSARFAGLPLEHWRDRAFARRVAYMPQFTPAADGMSVRELVALGRFPWHGTLGRFTAEDAQHVEQALARTDLLGMAQRMVDTLSGGERQRAWLALMFAQAGDCILLDEPTSALDIAHEAQMLKLVREISRERGATVIVVLHDINLAARSCDDILALRDGRLVAHGPVAAIMQPDVLGAIYGVPMGVMPHPSRDELIGYVL